MFILSTSDGINNKAYEQLFCRHREVLEIYISKLRNFKEAEKYCVMVHEQSKEKKDCIILLLQVRKSSFVCVLNSNGMICH